MIDVEVAALRAFEKDMLPGRQRFIEDHHGVRDVRMQQSGGIRRPGDNVGDVAGMGADLFESYAGSIIAPIALVAFTGAGIEAGQAGDRGIIELLTFPMAIATVGMVAAVIGSLFVRGGDTIEIHDLPEAVLRATSASTGQPPKSTV